MQNNQDLKKGLFPYILLLIVGLSIVLFYGTADNVNELMQAMDVFILPSRYEGLCITAIEAQAAGLPCLMTNTISRDTKISSNCQFIDINAPIKTWINAVKYIIWQDIK